MAPSIFPNEIYTIIFEFQDIIYHYWRTRYVLVRASKIREFLRCKVSAPQDFRFPFVEVFWDKATKDEEAFGDLFIKGRVQSIFPSPAGRDLSFILSHESSTVGIPFLPTYFDQPGPHIKYIQPHGGEIQLHGILYLHSRYSWLQSITNLQVTGPYIDTTNPLDTHRSPCPRCMLRTVFEFCPKITTICIINTDAEVNECHTEVPLPPPSTRTIELRAITIADELPYLLQATDLSTLILHFRETDKISNYARFEEAARGVFCYSAMVDSLMDINGSLLLKLWSNYSLVGGQPSSMQESSEETKSTELLQKYNFPYTPYYDEDEEIWEDEPEFVYHGGSSYFE
ncbi:hypothetical protein TWF481_006220 [Arthrobotrys musiformis]|uniref:F-box domain-containing protein n=1 Tax=Arthrobotrys musiformis TaxID=47236 RepID=A0AAV9WG37_9PEZI